MAVIRAVLAVFLSCPPACYLHFIFCVFYGQIKNEWIIIKSQSCCTWYTESCIGTWTFSTGLDHLVVILVTEYSCCQEVIFCCIVEMLKSTRSNKTWFKPVAKLQPGTSKMNRLDIKTRYTRQLYEYIQGESKINPLRLLHIFQLVVIHCRRKFFHLFAIHILIHVPTLVYLFQYLWKL